VSDDPRKDKSIRVYFHSEEKFLEIVTRLPECKSLRDLELRGFPVRKTYISKLIAKAPLLERLSFQNGTFEPGVFEVLQQAPRLKHLSVIAVDITNADLRQIADLPHLESFSTLIADVPRGGIEEFQRITKGRVQVLSMGRVIDAPVEK
jgi:hypothetical protein